MQSISCFEFIHWMLARLSWTVDKFHFEDTRWWDDTIQGPYWSMPKNVPGVVGELSLHTEPKE